MIAKIRRWLWPDTSGIERGSYWVSKKQFWDDRVSTLDVVCVSNVTSDGYVFSEHVHDSEFPSNLPAIRFSAPLFRLKDFVRKFSPVTERELEEMGFRTSIAATK